MNDNLLASLNAQVADLMARVERILALDDDGNKEAEALADLIYQIEDLNRQIAQLEVIEVEDDVEYIYEDIDDGEAEQVEV
jgi:TolA-binding protein